MTEMPKSLCWHQNFVPWGCLSLTCGYNRWFNHILSTPVSDTEPMVLWFTTFKVQIGGHVSMEMFPWCWRCNTHVTSWQKSNRNNGHAYSKRLLRQLYIINGKQLFLQRWRNKIWRPSGSVAQCSECLQGMREILSGSYASRIMCFFLPCYIWRLNVGPCSVWKQQRDCLIGHCLFPSIFRRTNLYTGTNLIKQGEIAKCRPCGSDA